MTYVVIITGGIGSGKTAVSDLLQSRGAAIVDTDVISRQLTAARGRAMPQLVAQFGPEIVTADGALARERMRSLVFSDPAAKTTLEGILHPMIRAEAYRQVTAAAAPYVALVVPLLVESAAYRELADRVLVVDCPEPIQIERTMRRSGLEREQVERIVSAQAPRAARLALADDVIINDVGMDALAVGVEQLHERYLQAAAKKSQRDGTAD